MENPTAAHTSCHFNGLPMAEDWAWPGPLPLTSSGKVYSITCSDYFTKWSEATANPDTSPSPVYSKIIFSAFRHAGIAINLVNMIKRGSFSIRSMISKHYKQEGVHIEEHLSLMFNQLLFEITRVALWLSSILTLLGWNSISPCFCCFHIHHIREDEFQAASAEVKSRSNQHHNSAVCHPQANGWEEQFKQQSIYDQGGWRKKPTNGIRKSILHNTVAFVYTCRG